MSSLWQCFCNFFFVLKEVTMSFVPTTSVTYEEMDAHFDMTGIFGRNESVIYAECYGIYMLLSL